MKILLLLFLLLSSCTWHKTIKQGYAFVGVVKDIQVDWKNNTDSTIVAIVLLDNGRTMNYVVADAIGVGDSVFKQKDRRIFTMRGR